MTFRTVLSPRTKPLARHLRSFGGFRVDHPTGVWRTRRLPRGFSSAHGTKQTFADQGLQVRLPALIPRAKMDVT